MEGPCRKDLSDIDQLAIRLARIKLSLRTGELQGVPRITMPGTKKTFSCYDGVWDLERPCDRILRQSYGKSKDLEFFIQNRGHYHHQKFVNYIRDHGLPGLEDEKAVHESYYTGDAPDENNLACGEKSDVLLRAGNNRRTFVEVSSRGQLTGKYVKERLALRPCKTDKMAFVTLTWAEEAEISTVKAEGASLFVIEYDGKNDIVIKKKF
jgi:hypothetical protein